MLKLPRLKSKWNPLPPETQRYTCPAGRERTKRTNNDKEASHGRYRCVLQSHPAGYKALRTIIAMIISSKFHEVSCPARNWAIILMGWWLAFEQWISSKDLQYKPRGRVINPRRQRILYPDLVHLEACQTTRLARFEVKKIRGDELIAIDGESTATPSNKPILSALGVELDDFRLILNRLLVPVKSPVRCAPKVNPEN